MGQRWLLVMLGLSLISGFELFSIMCYFINVYRLQWYQVLK